MLLKNENQIIRVLKSQGNKALVIDCIKRTMPKWVDGDSLSNYDDCGEDEMYERTDYKVQNTNSLNDVRRIYCNNRSVNNVLLNIYTALMDE